MDIREFEAFISEAYTHNNNNTPMMDPNWLALKLASFLDIYKSHDIIFREKFVVLIDKLLNDDDLCTWRNRLSVSIQSTIKCMLLDIMKLEESELVMLKLRNIVWKLAASLLPDNNWPELLPFLYQCVSSSSTSDDDSNKYLKLSAFLILARLAGNIGETLVSWVKRLHSVFRNTLNDDTLNDLDVRLGAMCTVISFIVNVLTLNEKERFQDLLPGVMNTLTGALLTSNGSKEEGVAAKALTFLIELAKKDPRFFKQQLVIVVGTVIDIAEDESLENATRHLAVEFLITLVEAKEKTPGMMKRLPLFISRCFAVLLKLLLDVKDDPAWHSAETVDDDTGATSNFHVGEEYLDRFSLALGGKSIAHIAKEQLSDYLDAPEWAKRHAALFALTFIAEGCIENLAIMASLLL